MWESNNNLTEFDIESNGYYLAYAIVPIKFTFSFTVSVKKCILITIIS